MSADYKEDIEVLSVITATFLVLAYVTWRRESAARNWPQVPGVVVASRLSSGRPPSDLTYHGRKSVSPIIEYEFSHQGQPFRSSHWRLGNFTIGTPMDAGSVVSRYPVGAPVTVFVNPRDPAKSVLELGASLCWVPFAFGMFCLFLTIVLVLASLSQRT